MAGRGAEQSTSKQRRRGGKNSAEQSRAPLHRIQHIDSYSPFLANGQRKGRLQYLLAPLWKSLGIPAPGTETHAIAHYELPRLVNLLSSPRIASDASNERNAIIGICPHW